MTLRVIGAGFGRTGTESMKRALEELGFGPCHHMYEVLPSPEQQAIWTAIGHGAVPDWDRAFAGFRSAVDWPSAHYWRELAAHYPEAKVILTLRSAESWWASFERTILKVIEGFRERGETDHLGYRIVAARALGGRPGDRAHAIAAFEANTTEVLATIPPERLLVHKIGDGWEPLCAFLGCPVPDTPYPRGNDQDDFHERVDDLLSPGG